VSEKNDMKNSLSSLMRQNKISWKTNVKTQQESKGKRERRGRERCGLKRVVNTIIRRAYHVQFLILFSEVVSHADESPHRSQHDETGRKVDVIMH
jgi:hypothetical protein